MVLLLQSAPGARQATAVTALSFNINLWPRKVKFKLCGCGEPSGEPWWMSEQINFLEKFL